MSRSERNDQKRFVLSVLDAWRKKTQRLTTAQRKAISNLDDLSAPCQVEVIWLRNVELQLDSQLWLITKFPDAADRQVRVTGPIDTRDALAELSKLARSRRFGRKMPADNRTYFAKRYRALVEGAISRFVEDFKWAIRTSTWSRRERSAGVGSKSWLTSESFLWLVKGDYRSMDEDSVTESIVNRAREESARPKVATASDEDRAPRHNGFGTYIEPNVYIGTRPKKPFQERLQESVFDSLPSMPRKDAVFTTEAGDGLRVSVTADGFVALSAADEEEGLRFINVFMSLLALSGTPALVVRPHEIGEVTMDDESGDIIGSRMPLTMPRFLHDYPMRTPAWIAEMTQVVPLRTIRSIVRELDAVRDHRPTCALLMLFGEAYTHFQRREYSQSILLSWILVERWLEQLTVARSSEVMSASPSRQRHESGIDVDLLAWIESLRRIRSSFVHGLKPVSEADAEGALLLAIHLLKSLEGISIK